MVSRALKLKTPGYNNLLEKKNRRVRLVPFKGLKVTDKRSSKSRTIVKEFLSSHGYDFMNGNSFFCTHLIISKVWRLLWQALWHICTTKELTLDIFSKKKHTFVFRYRPLLIIVTDRKQKTEGCILIYRGCSCRSSTGKRENFWGITLQHIQQIICLGFKWVETEKRHFVIESRKFLHLTFFEKNLFWGSMEHFLGVYEIIPCSDYYPDWMVH